MDFVRVYYDICKEIEILELRLMDLENELKAVRKELFAGTMPGEHPVHVPLDRALRDYDSVVERIREASDMLTNKQLIRRKVESNIRDFQGVEYQVAYMRDIEGKALYTIADELGFSYDWIRKVSSRIKAQRRHKRDNIS